MGLTVHFEVLNQLGTPMMYSSSLALQPAAGIQGRIFFRTDSPYGIYRDNGTSWDQIAGSGVGLSGSGTATQIAYFSAATTLASSANLFWDNTNARLGVNTSTPSASFNVLGNAIATNTLTGITGTSISALTYSSFTNDFTFNSGITTSASVLTIGLLTDNILNYSGANTINVTSYNTSSLLRNNFTFGSAAASVTYTQSTGIRALTNIQNQYIQNGANSGTISHYANIQILGDQKTGAGLTTFTNRYGLLINDFNEFTAGNTYTNRWGIYQAGLNENNFFAGKLGIGSGYAPGTYQLDVNGTARVSGQLTTGLTTGTSLNIVVGSGNTGIAINSNTFIIRYGNQLHLKAPDIGPLAIVNYANTSYDFCASYTGGNAFFKNDLTIGANISLGGVYTFESSAMLNVISTTKGFLPPRMTTIQKNAIATPAAGLVIYDSTLNKLCIYTTSWETITSV
jgi:hypothetical protein